MPEKLKAYFIAWANLTEQIQELQELLMVYKRVYNDKCLSVVESVFCMYNT